MLCMRSRAQDSKSPDAHPLNLVSSANQQWQPVSSTRMSAPLISQLEVDRKMESNNTKLPSDPVPIIVAWTFGPGRTCKGPGPGSDPVPNWKSGGPCNYGPNPSLLDRAHTVLATCLRNRALMSFHVLCSSALRASSLPAISGFPHSLKNAGRAAHVLTCILPGNH